VGCVCGLAAGCADSLVTAAGGLVARDAKSIARPLPPPITCYRTARRYTIHAVYTPSTDRTRYATILLLNNGMSSMLHHYEFGAVRTHAQRLRDRF